jgi:hypothetical protein
VGRLDAQQIARGVESDDSGAPVPVAHEIEGEPVLQDGGRAVAHRLDKSPLHLGARGGATGVQHASR